MRRACSEQWTWRGLDLVTKRLTVRYGGVPDLDRTVALQSGEVAPAGIHFEYMRVHSPVDLQSGFPDGLDVVETPLFDLVTSIHHGTAIGIPVFTARYLPEQLLWNSSEQPLSDLRDLEAGRVGFDAEDKTSRIWAEVLLVKACGLNPETIEWVGFPGREALVDASSQMNAVCLRPPVEETGLVSVVQRRAMNAEELNTYGGVLPIFHVVAMKRDLYERNRWVAVEVMDAFLRAKVIGMERLRYFGALAVGLPWLRRSIDQLNTFFGDDAYPYGLAENLDCLREFMRAATRAGLTSRDVTPDSLFAPETVGYPGLPNSTSYLVPLSGPRGWSIETPESGDS